MRCVGLPEILRGAARIFAEKGFQGARTEEICAAGVSPGTLFRYFPDKQAIILAIVEIEFADYTNDIIRLANKDGLYWLMGIRGDELLALIRPSGSTCVPMPDGIGARSGTRAASAGDGSGIA